MTARVYTLFRFNNVLAIEGRLPDGTFIPFGPGRSAWAFETETEALEFWNALITCAELDPWPTKFVDLHMVGREVAWPGVLSIDRLADESGLAIVVGLAHVKITRPEVESVVRALSGWLAEKGGRA